MSSTSNVLTADARADWEQWLRSLSPATRVWQSAIQSPGLGMLQESPVWYLVEIPDSQYPTLRSFNSVDALLSRLRELVGLDYHVYIFFGWRSCLTSGPLRRLICPDGTALPLDDLPLPSVDETGFMGRVEDLFSPEDDWQEDETAPSVPMRSLSEEAEPPTG